ncbi:hypothetical protein KSP40_PGU006888 [Platanthera guangdongensis]|uniref:Uncharacterized protein n=1 Tax=Platanthera guangdongensis TaxID=2320717 RepID=A0ABR2M137_9ASPA
MRDHLHIEEGLIPRMYLDLFKEHGTTIIDSAKGRNGFDDDEFHARVHLKLPYDVLKSDPVVRNLYLSMPWRKLIFANTDQYHVK